MSAAAPAKVSDTVSSIEAAIKALWRADSVSAGEQRGAGRVRASTINLVAVVGGAGPETVGDPSNDPIAYRHLIDDVAARLSARTFVLSVDPRAEPWALAAEVTAVCQVGSSAGLCSERVDLRLGAAMTKRAASIVETLLDPRLPSALLVGPGAHKSVVDAVIPSVSRVVLDSQQFGLTRARDVAASSAARVEDLAFTRGRRWRDMLARCFDDGALVPALSSVLAVEIDHAPVAGGEPSADAELLIAWLATRLGWKGGGDLTKLSTSDGGLVDIVLRARPRDDLAPGRIAAVTLRALLGGGELVGHVARDLGTEHLSWSLTWPGGSTSRRFAVPRRDAADLVLRSISDAAGGELAREAVEFAARWRGAAA